MMIFPVEFVESDLPGRLGIGSLIVCMIRAVADVSEVFAEFFGDRGLGFCILTSVRLVEEGSRLSAALNVVVSLGLGLIAALAGWYGAQMIWG